jgi:hypothetical protein
MNIKTAGAILNDQNNKAVGKTVSPDVTAMINRMKAGNYPAGAKITQPKASPELADKIKKSQKKTIRTPSGAFDYYPTPEEQQVFINFEPNSPQYLALLSNIQKKIMDDLRESKDPTLRPDPAKAEFGMNLYKDTPEVDERQTYIDALANNRSFMGNVASGMQSVSDIGSAYLDVASSQKAQFLDKYVLSKNNAKKAQQFFEDIESKVPIYGNLVDTLKGKNLSPDAKDAMMSGDMGRLAQGAGIGFGMLGGILTPASQFFESMGTMADKDASPIERGLNEMGLMASVVPGAITGAKMASNVAKGMGFKTAMGLAIRQTAREAIPLFEKFEKDNALGGMLELLKSDVVVDGKRIRWTAEQVKSWKEGLEKEAKLFAKKTGLSENDYYRMVYKQMSDPNKAKFDLTPSLNDLSGIGVKFRETGVTAAARQADELGQLDASIKSFASKTAKNAKEMAANDPVLLGELRAMGITAEDLSNMTDAQINKLKKDLKARADLVRNQQPQKRTTVSTNASRVFSTGDASPFLDETPESVAKQAGLRLYDAMIKAGMDETQARTLAGALVPVLKFSAQEGNPVGAVVAKALDQIDPTGKLAQLEDELSNPKPFNDDPFKGRVERAGKYIEEQAQKNPLFDRPVEDVPDNEVVQKWSSAMESEIVAWLKANPNYSSFYGADVQKANKLIQANAPQLFGRKLDNHELELYHLFSALASPQNIPANDSSQGLLLFDQWLKNSGSPLSSKGAYYKTRWVKPWQPTPLDLTDIDTQPTEKLDELLVKLDKKTYGKKALEKLSDQEKIDILVTESKRSGFLDASQKENTGVFLGDATGNYEFTQITPKYYTSGLDNVQKVLTHFNGDVKKTMEWLKTQHRVDDIAKMVGKNIKDLGVGSGGKDFHEYLPNDPNAMAFGIFGIGDTPKLGSYWLNRIGIQDTVTKDMWWARTFARYSGKPLFDSSGNLLTEPFSHKTADGLRLRKLADQATDIVASKVGMTRAEVQEALWDYEQLLYVHAGSPRQSSFISDGAAKGIDFLKNPSKIPTNKAELDKQMLSPREFISFNEIRPSDELSKNLNANELYQAGDDVQEQWHQAVQDILASNTPLLKKVFGDFRLEQGTGIFEGKKSPFVEFIHPTQEGADMSTALFGQATMQDAVAQSALNPFNAQGLPAAVFVKGVVDKRNIDEVNQILTNYGLGGSLKSDGTFIVLDTTFGSPEKFKSAVDEITNTFTGNIGKGDIVKYDSYSHGKYIDRRGTDPDNFQGIQNQFNPVTGDTPYPSGLKVLDDAGNRTTETMGIADALRKNIFNPIVEETRRIATSLGIDPKNVDAYVDAQKDAITQTLKGLGLEQRIKGTLKGYYEAKSKTIALVENNADVSTVIHEVGHHLKEVLLGSEQYGDIIRKMYGGSDDIDGHERFARQLEKYFHTGQVPNEKLKPLFESIKDWMRGIYKRWTKEDLDQTTKEIFDSIYSKSDKDVDDFFMELDRIKAAPKNKVVRTGNAVTTPPLGYDYQNPNSQLPAGATINETSRVINLNDKPVGLEGEALKTFNDYKAQADNFSKELDKQVEDQIANLPSPLPEGAGTKLEVIARIKKEARIQKEKFNLEMSKQFRQEMGVLTNEERLAMGADAPEPHPDLNFSPNDFEKELNPALTDEAASNIDQLKKNVDAQEAPVKATPNQTETETSINTPTEPTAPATSKMKDLEPNAVDEAVQPSGTSTATATVTDGGQKATSARRAWSEDDKQTFKVVTDELPEPTRKSWEQAFKESVDNGYDSEWARTTAQEIRNKARSLSDTETAGMVREMARLKNRHEQIINDIDTNGITEANSIALKNVEKDWDAVQHAVALSGSESGRNLAAHKLTINDKYDLISVVSRAKANAGGDIPQDVRDNLAKLVSDLEKANRVIKRLEQTAKDRLEKYGKATTNRKVSREEAGIKSARTQHLNALKKAMGGGDIDGLSPRMANFSTPAMQALAKYALTFAEQAVGNMEEIVALTIQSLGASGINANDKAIKKALMEWATPSPQQNKLLTMAEYQRDRLMSDIRMSISDLKYSPTQRAMREIASAPRAIKATADFSAPLRQGLLLSAGNPKKAMAAFGKAMVAWADPVKSAKFERDLHSSPMAPVRKQAGLYIASQENLEMSEEIFMSRLAEKIPGFGKVMKMSERHYVTFLNQLRATVFDSMVASMNPTDEEMKALANFINVATGRGRMSNETAQEIGSALFSARFTASRVQAPIDALGLTKSGKAMWASPVAKRQLLASWGGLVSAYAMAGGLATLAGGTVGVDPDSPDFGKIKIGDARFDVFGGLMQPMRLIAKAHKQMASNEPAKYGKGTYDSIAQFFKYKTNPAIGIVLSTIDKKDAIGRPYLQDKFGNMTAGTVLEDYAKEFSPLVVKDLTELWGLAGEGMDKANVPMSAKVIGTALIPFGVGVQAYPDKPMKKNESVKRPIRRN